MSYGTVWIFLAADFDEERITLEEEKQGVHMPITLCRVCLLPPGFIDEVVLFCGGFRIPISQSPAVISLFTIVEGPMVSFDCPLSQTCCWPMRS